jgi:hypothetical protein
MKRMMLLAVLTLALPLAAFANNTIDFGNLSGTLTGTSSGMSLTANLTSVYGLPGFGTVQGTDLGTISFTTGSLIAGGSMTMGGSFNPGALGSFVITSNGGGGLPSGVLFTGSFTGPVSWQISTLSNGNHQYTLSGTVSGTLYNGTKVTGLSYEVTVSTTGKGFFNGKIGVGSGDLNVVSSVPEPGTLGLLGTGLIGLAGVLHRKLKS